MSKKIPPMVHAGYEVGTGKEVSTPLAHIFVTGQTQVSGKTTLLQALVARSGRPALAFETKRGEALEGRSIPPYLPQEGAEEIHWRYVETIMASALGQRALKYERLQIIQAVKGAFSLEDVRRNLTRLQAKAKGPVADIYLLLGEYLDLVLPEMRALKASAELTLKPGLNVMKLTHATPELQALVIGAAIQHINETMQGILTVFPEAWQFAPRDRNTAAKFQAEKMARMGAVLENFLLTDSQDIIGVSPVLRQASTIWFIGAQREGNELKRGLNVIKTSGIAAPKPSEIGTLPIGRFYTCHGNRAIKTYIQPAWMSEDNARTVALGGEMPEPPPPAKKPSNRSNPMSDTAIEETLRSIPGVTVSDMPRPAFGGACAAVHAQNGAKALALHDAQPPAVPAQPESEDVLPDSETKALLQQLLAKFDTKRPEVIIDPERAPAGAFEPREELLYQQFKARLLKELPAITAGGVVTVTPPEKLRKAFQREEAERITAAARALRPLPRRIMTFLEGLPGESHSQAAIARRINRGLNGEFGKAVKELVALGFIESSVRVGAKTVLRQKVAADLQAYKPSESEVEAVYQNVLFQLAIDNEGE